MELRNLRVFVEIAQAGSLAAAGRRLQLSAMAVSRGLSTLEQQVGARLVHRSTRSLSLTAEGEALFPHARTILEEEAQARAAIHPATRGIAGMLRVTCSASFARKVLMPLIPGLLDEHPELQIDLLATDTIADLTGQGIDLAIRHATLPDSGLIARRIAQGHRQLCAAPSYLEEHGMPLRMADLAKHRCLRMSGVTHWAFGQGKRCPVGGRFTASSIEALHDACLAGMGIAALADWNVEADLATGRLVAITVQDADPEPLDVWALYPDRRGITPKVRLMIDALADQFAASGARQGGLYPNTGNTQ